MYASVLIAVYATGTLIAAGQLPRRTAPLERTHSSSSDDSFHSIREPHPVEALQKELLGKLERPDSTPEEKAHALVRPYPPRDPLEEAISNVLLGPLEHSFSRWDHAVPAAIATVTKTVV